MICVVRVRVGTVVHSMYWHLHNNPLGVNAPPNACYWHTFPACIPAPIMATDVHPTVAPVTCFWCVIDGPPYLK